MAWKRYFSAVTPNRNVQPRMPSNHNGETGGAGTSSKVSSYLPEVYAGHPNRIQRYYQYDDMDRDSDINAALDTIADFCTQSEEQNKEPFEIYYTGTPNETEVSILKNALVRWNKINEFRSRLWHMFRSTIKNGDAFFLRDPETHEWLWIDTFMVEMVKVDETAGKTPDEYIIRGLDYNKSAKFATIAADPSSYRSPLGASNATGTRPPITPSQAPSVFSLSGSNIDPRQRDLMAGQRNQLSVVAAEHVIHLSLSVGMDVNWPFGASILEPVFKTYKQKELLEDSIIIYRVQRAPERRIFYIDTGSMPPIRAKAHIEQIKNEIHQRRIPNRGGGGTSMIDASYSPLCVAMDTKIPLLDGRTLTIEELAAEYKAGKENWTYSCDPKTGEIMPGNITWAGMTRKQANVIRITLDNGETLTCTPDHKIPVLGKGYIEAQNLTPEDSLISCETLSAVKTRHLISNEVLPETIDVGTLTIDGGEEYHGHHNFAISAGIFIKNSMLDDYYFATGSEGRGSKVETLPGGECFALDTKIVLLDGRTLRLQDIISEFEQGKQLWTYSCDPTTGEIVPGIINWAGITRKNTQVIKLHLDNGKTVTVTPDHKFPVQGRGFVEAQDLTTEDSLFPFETRTAEIKKGRTKDYKQVFQSKTKKWEFVHRLVAKYFKGHPLVKEITFDEVYRNASKTTVHHIDFDRFNNDPMNLSWVNYEDHYKYHSETINQNFGHLAREGIKRFFANMTDEEAEIYFQSRSQTRKENFDKKSETEKANIIAECIANLRRGKATDKQLWLLQNDPIWRAATLAKRGAGISQSFTEERLHDFNEEMKIRWQNGTYDQLIENQTLVFNDELFATILSLIDNNTSTVTLLLEKANKNAVVRDIFLRANKGKKPRNRPVEEFQFALRHIKAMFTDRGVTWKSVRAEVLNQKGEKLRGVRNFATDIKMMQCIDVAFKKGITILDDMLDHLNHNSEFMRHFTTLNQNTHHLAKNDRIGYHHLVTILQDHGYQSWKQFKTNGKFNHRITKIEWLEEKQDTGTVTIDGLEVFHNHHTLALEAGIFAKNCTGEIGDLLYFSKKMARGLRIPSTYLALGGTEEQGSATFNDGKLGAALIQEFRFNKYCMRIQALLSPKFDADFKKFLRKSGVEIDESLFELQFLPPQNFSKYRQIEVDAQQVQVYTQLAENKKLSERFKLKRFLNLTDEELLENEKLWSEENAAKLKKATGASPADTPSQDLSSVGIRGGGGFGDDMGGGEEPMPDDMGGDEGAAPDAGAPGGGAPGGAPGAGPAPAPDAGGGGAPGGAPT